MLNQAHTKRNLAEYESDLDVTGGFVEELIEHVASLIAAAQALETPVIMENASSALAPGVVTQGRALTAAQFHQLADVPPALT